MPRFFSSKFDAGVSQVGTGNSKVLWLQPTGAECRTEVKSVKYGRKGMCEIPYSSLGFTGQEMTRGFQDNPLGEVKNDLIRRLFSIHENFAIDQ